jgi:glucokinase
MSVNSDVDTGRFVGVAASVSNLQAVCLDPAGNLIATERKAVLEPDDPIVELVEFIKHLRSVFGDFARIGVAVPGLIHRETKRVAFSTYIPSHSTSDIVREIEGAAGVSAEIENDANAAAYGEFRLGAGKDSRSMFYATLGTGVGGAFIIEGKVWHGAAGFAGEFGSVAVNSDGMRLEDVASASNIIRRTRDRVYQDSTSSLNKLDAQAITLEDILSAAAAEDDLALMMLRRTGAYIGIAIASVINLLNVETIVVGGQTMTTGEPLLESIINSAKELSFRPSFEATKIVSGTLSDNAAAIGAALLAGSK